MADVRRLVELRANGNPAEPLELRINHMEGHLLGMLQAIRAIDPDLIPALRDQFESDICGGKSTEIDLLVFAKLGSLQASMLSPRALDCALWGRKTEDVVLWSLLDAWQVAGQPALPSVASIQSNAQDQRTTRRLAPRDGQSTGASGMPLRRRPPAPGTPDQSGRPPIAARSEL
jgi:hypothetical protein